MTSVATMTGTDHPKSKPPTFTAPTTKIATMPSGCEVSTVPAAGAVSTIRAGAQCRRCRREAQCWSKSPSGQGFARSERSILERHKRGYRFGMAWSVLEPRGEWGDTHVSQMIPIPKTLFEIGPDRGWTLDRELYEGALLLAGLHPTQLRGYLWKGQK